VDRGSWIQPHGRLEAPIAAQGDASAGLEFYGQAEVGPLPTLDVSHAALTERRRRFRNVRAPFSTPNPRDLERDPRSNPRPQVLEFRIYVSRSLFVIAATLTRAGRDETPADSDILTPPACRRTERDL